MTGTTNEVIGSGKIRDSCNSCSSQKIRCTKERPACARCVSKGLDCAYSISMRTGRPSRASQAAAAAAAAATTNMTATDSSVTSSSDNSSSYIAVSPPRSPSNAPNQPKQQLTPMMGHHEGSSTGVAESAESILAHLDQQFFLNDEFWVPDSGGFQTDLAEQSTSMHSMSPAGASTMLDWNDISTKEISVPIGKSGTVPPGQNSTQRAQGHQQQQDCVFPNDNLGEPQSGSSYGPSNETAMTGSCGDSAEQSCLTSLSQLTLELHVQDSVCTTAICSGSSQQHREETNVHRGVDSVLLQNRSAVRLLARVLDCPCSRELSVTLAAYLVACKIVAWYGAILGVGCTPSVATRITEQPIVMGSYSLDASVQRSVRAKVVLSELSLQVEPLLASLPQFHVTLGELASWTTSSPSSRPVPPVDQQRCFLRDQLQKVVYEALKLTSQGAKELSEKPTSQPVNEMGSSVEQSIVGWRKRRLGNRRDVHTGIMTCILRGADHATRGD
ncbi:hypothetical protein M409DRAFT_49215 [Zasmidium cellare ATCC 36951]|uniref:Zn(2)-C6 fungal-type domain-containing protein n=1 Tax=Zasmidium cellare ATCC 36951 TaxID=1080233 RepID=A0A6A6D4U4_ZASCE|nr:uncharacterized protein M409DRAFT_49215 [Zasmidium cellare ATCC 36951]KAF2172666.1 hypothetical protein M409DRAFT_49215 [Zasmidium cellare ATCC 36951]